MSEPRIVTVTPRVRAVIGATTRTQLVCLLLRRQVVLRTENRSGRRGEDLEDAA